MSETPTAAPEAAGDVSSAIVVLCNAVCGKRSPLSGPRFERFIEVLAGNKLAKRDFILGRARRSVRVHAAIRVYKNYDSSVPANFVLRRV